MKIKSTNKSYCPCCESIQDILLIETTETVKIKKDKITVKTDFYRCSSCKEEFTTSENIDTTAQAYTEYRKRLGLLQPEEITSYRKKYQLTQKELSQLLGISPATLNRYEKGSIQDKAHDNLLRLAFIPSELIKLIERNPDTLSQDKKQLILRTLQNQLPAISPVSLQEASLNEFNGYKMLDLEKVFNIILLFCSDAITKTKLNKFLFYNDFLYFKENTISMSGLTYIHLPYGPVPSFYEMIYAQMVQDNWLTIEEEYAEYSTEPIEKYLQKKLPDLACFTTNELKTIFFIQDKFKNLTARKLSDHSHEEEAYIKTSNGEKISYHYAETLQGTSI